ncbi:unnamed protein product [Camellia sinensis]
MFQLVQKLKSCKIDLRSWSREMFRNNKFQLALLKSRLDEVQGKPPSEAYMQHQNQLKREIEVLLGREEMYLHQCSRIRWLQYEDRNSSFFNASVIQRRQRNQILKLQKEDGTWVESVSEIDNYIREYFENLFSNVGVRDMESALSVVEPLVSREMNTLLIKPVTDTEIKEAVFQLGPLKSPRSDGFPGFFYHTYWDTVNSQIFNVVGSFFNGGYLLKELNQTNLVLIPKVPHLEKLSHLRPISLCNFSLKIIMKILANRLEQVLGKLISPQQSAFVLGRMIQDNILVAHETFHSLKILRRGTPAMKIKLDFNKAYDRIQWDFLLAVLARMGFHSKWIQWIRKCVTTVRFRIVVNGAIQLAITPSRGLRQGDPLSPYLFLLVSDVFSKLLSIGLRSREFSRLKLARHCPTLSHLLFADDALLFLKADPQESANLLDILRTYCEASGQVINFDKSNITFASNVPQNIQDEICQKTRITKASSTVSYLGLPSSWGRSKAEAYSYLLEKMLSKLQGWKAKLLSLAGREVLLKAVAQSPPSYVMACFAFPKHFCEKLNSYIRNF